MIISTVVTGADYLVSVMSLPVNDKDPRLMPDLIVAQLLPRMRMIGPGSCRQFCFFRRGHGADDRGALVLQNLSQ